MRALALIGAVAVAAAALLTAGCSGDASAEGGSVKLTLVAYSTPREAYE
jgi:ABC-type glycerol-3-phosphate transport system substrate-binding protein